MKSESLVGRIFVSKTCGAKYFIVRHDIEQESVLFYMINESGNLSGDAVLFDVNQIGKSDFVFEDEDLLIGKRFYSLVEEVMYEVVGVDTGLFICRKTTETSFTSARVHFSRVIIENQSLFKWVDDVEREYQLKIEHFLIKVRDWKREAERLQKAVEGTTEKLFRQGEIDAFDEVLNYWEHKIKVEL